MPTSRLSPSHTTQFKSTIRSGSSLLPAHSPAPILPSDFRGSGDEAEISPQLEHTEWDYAGEGEGVLFVRYSPSASASPDAEAEADGHVVLLRLPKVVREQQSGGEDKGEEAPEPSPVAAALAEERTQTMRIKLPADSFFLQKLAARIELQRGKDWRRRDGVDVRAGGIEAVLLDGREGLSNS